MIYVLSGGQTGATLTVTSSDAGTVTVSNTSIEKSYSKSITAGGSAVFKGLATGTWTVKLTDGSKTSTKNIKITSDYSTSIAYFSATISITYPAKSKCVVKNSSDQTVASDTNTGSSTKTWTATVNATGAYTVTATATDGSGKSKSQSVSITADGQSVSATLSYEVDIFNNGAIVPFSKIEKPHGKVTIGKTILFEKGADGGYDKGATAYTTDTLDITDYDYVVFEGSFSQVIDSNADKSRAGVTTITPHANDTSQMYVAHAALDTTNREWTVDISALTGNHYICVSAGNGYVDNLIGSITRIYLV